jgi:hypothetical protein
MKAPSSAKNGLKRRFFGAAARRKSHLLARRFFGATARRKSRLLAADFPLRASQRFVKLL